MNLAAACKAFVMELVDEAELDAAFAHARAVVTPIVRLTYIGAAAHAAAADGIKAVRKARRRGGRR